MDTTIDGSGTASLHDGVMDDEFLRGLQSILGPMRASGASQEEIDNVTARAKQFYLSRRPPASSTTNGLGDASSQQTPAETMHSQNEAGQGGQLEQSEQSRGRILAPEEPADDQPRYPLSFDELAEMIATGAHIPGIREIPNKINEAHPSEPVLAKTPARKPWEAAGESSNAGAPTLSALLGQQEEDHIQE